MTMQAFARRGAVLVAALVTLLVVTLIAGTLVRSALAAHRHLRQMHNELQAQWLAEAAAARAIVQLAGEAGYTGELWQPKIHSAGEETTGVAAIRAEKLDSQPGHIRIVVQARYPDDPWRRAAVEREYIVAAAEPK